MKNLGVIFLLLFSLIKGTEARALSPEAEISLLTSAPYEAEVFTVYGHAALRVSDPGQKIDVVFNYGMFSFDKPFFIYRFVKGETDYMLGVMPYAHYGRRRSARPSGKPSSRTRGPRTASTATISSSTTAPPVRRKSSSKTSRVAWTTRRGSPKA